jgi:predicted anti-sigma-YlaC factor YlaD
MPTDDWNDMDTNGPHGEIAEQPMPDLSGAIARLNAAADRAAHWSMLRILLGVVAVQVIAFSLPALVLGDEHDTATHAARHLGAFEVAYGVALIVVVVRPARARSILPVAMVLAGAQVISAIVDLASGRIPLVGEARHLPQVISVVLIWLLAVPRTGRLSEWWPTRRNVRRNDGRVVDLAAAGSSRHRPRRDH